MEGISILGQVAGSQGAHKSLCFCVGLSVKVDSLVILLLW